MTFSSTVPIRRSSAMTISRMMICVAFAGAAVSAQAVPVVSSGAPMRRRFRARSMPSAHPSAHSIPTSSDRSAAVGVKSTGTGCPTPSLRLTICPVTSSTRTARVARNSQHRATAFKSARTPVWHPSSSAPLMQITRAYSQLSARSDCSLH